MQKKNLLFEEPFGYETKFKREILDLPKEHYIDAICVGLSDGEMFKLPDVLYKKVCIPLGDYKQTAGSHSSARLKIRQFFVFHLDKDSFRLCKLSKNGVGDL